jgi:arylsulfatase A-like enzyme
MKTSTMTATQVSRLLAALALFAAARAAAESQPSAASHRAPNILLIFSDDQSYRTVSCYPDAYNWVRTPNIDRLARRGVRFANAYIGAWCMPSRATQLTGHLQFGVESMRGSPIVADKTSSYDPARCPFWPRVFREHGYFTAQIGKWHTGIDTGFGRDWDYQAVWNRPGHPDNVTHYYYDQLIEFNGRPAKLVPGYSTDNYTRWALDFIGGASRDPAKPWFLWLCYSAPHVPSTPADRDLDAYPGVHAPVPADIYPPRPGKPAYASARAEWVPGPGGEPQLKAKHLTVAGGKTLDDWVRQDCQCVAAVDESVGQLVAALEKTGQLENTLVVFASDQGVAWGQHGFRHKLAPYDANIRGPLIVSMPGTLPEGAVCPAPVGGQDLIPTFFAFAGLELPWAMHGHDLTPVLRQPTAPWPHPLLMAHTGAIFGSDTDTIPTLDQPALMYDGVPWWLSLVEGRFKYIRTLVAGEIEELYDLEADPEELHNLARAPAHRARLLDMRRHLLIELKRTGAGMADHLPPVAPIE